MRCTVASPPHPSKPLMEAFGRGLVREPYLTSIVLCGGLVNRSGSAAQQEALLPPLISGDLRLAFAFAERQARFNLADVRLLAQVDGDSFVLTGHKSVVFDAAGANKLIVSARTGGSDRDNQGITLFVVDSDAHGLTRRDFRTVDGGQASEIEIAGVRVESHAVIGDVDQALPLIECAIDHGISAICAEAVGVMAVLHERTIDYLKTRKQFSQPIGDFQVLQHRAVDMFMACECSAPGSLDTSLSHAAGLIEIAVCHA